MNWKQKLNDWKNNNYFKYPKNIKYNFLWNTSPIINTNSIFNESFKIDKSLPIHQNYKQFNKYIKNNSKNKYCISFYNLNKDTLLIIPVPRKNKNFATIKLFCDNAINFTTKKILELCF